MNVSQISEEIRNAIDLSWPDEISEQDAKKKINTILEVRENRVKIFRGKGEKSPTFERLVGVKRIKTFDSLFTQNSDN